MSAYLWPDTSSTPSRGNMKKISSVLLLVFVLAACGSTPQVAAQNPEPPKVDAPKQEPDPGYEIEIINGKKWKVPTDVDFGTFPPLGGKAKLEQVRQLGLRQRPLRSEEAGWYVNELRNRRTFEVTNLYKGEMVWESIVDGVPRYLHSCGNRIAKLAARKVAEAPKPIVPATGTPTANASASSEPSFYNSWRAYWSRPWFWQYWGSRTQIDVVSEGGNVKVTAGDITVDASGLATVRVITR